MTDSNIIYTALLGNGIRLVERDDGTTELWRDDRLIGIRDDNWTARRIERALADVVEQAIRSRPTLTR